MKKLIAIAFVSVMMTASAHAAKQYGSAGCGLGSVIMGKDGSQVLAVTTNGSTGLGFWGQGTSYMSGTSNCVDGGTVAANKALPVFVAANDVALAKDIARGSGETVAHLSQVMGCDNAGQLASSLQKNYQAIYPTNAVESDQVTDSIINVVKSEQLTCKNVI